MLSHRYDHSFQIKTSHEKNLIIFQNPRICKMKLQDGVIQAYLTKSIILRALEMFQNYAAAHTEKNQGKYNR